MGQRTYTRIGPLAHVIMCFFRYTKRTTSMYGLPVTLMEERKAMYKIKSLAYALPAFALFVSVGNAKDIKDLTDGEFYWYTTKLETNMIPSGNPEPAVGEIFVLAAKSEMPDNSESFEDFPSSVFKSPIFYKQAQEAQEAIERYARFVKNEGLSANMTGARIDSDLSIISDRAYRIALAGISAVRFKYGPIKILRFFGNYETPHMKSFVGEIVKYIREQRNVMFLESGITTRREDTAQESWAIVYNGSLYFGVSEFRSSDYSEVKEKLDDIKSKVEKAGQTVVASTITQQIKTRPLGLWSSEQVGIIVYTRDPVHYIH
jgi:tetrahydromethanopterin S-methyltransferase subunit G